jgi:N-acetylmuramoyl-L-alanine amidase
VPNINLKTELISPGRPNRPGDKIHPTFITIHNTDNSDKGANASAHSKFVRNTGYYLLNGKKHWVSWHCTVDDTQMIQQLPFNEMAYHAGANANQTSIAIEICMNSDGDQDTANENAVNLTAALMKDLDIDIDHVRTHESWTGKKCPVLLLDNGNPGKKWQGFLDRVAAARKMIPPGAGLVALADAPLAAADNLIQPRPVDPPDKLENMSGEIDHRLVADQLSKQD